MPTTYAHYRFGCDVRKKLGEYEANIIENNIDIFNIGVYGPDILFYYRPFIKNKIIKLASKHHHQNFRIILEHATECIKRQEDKDKYLAYMYGFICHFALDSYCHGYINNKKRESGLAHNLMESEFDRMLLEMDGYNPIKYKPTSHIKPDKEIAKTIADIYIDVDEKTAYKSIKSMKSFCNFMVAPTFVSRAIIYTGLFVSGNLSKKRGMLITHKPDARCEETNKEIFRLYEKALELAVKMIERFKKNVFDDEKFTKITDHTFSTSVSVEAELDEDMKTLY